MKKFLLLTIIVSEVVVIIFLVLIAYTKETSLLGASDIIIPIQKSTLVFSEGTNSDLHFFEPRENRVIGWAPNGLPIEQNTINSDTLNERYNYTVEKQRDTFRIVTLGDSFTYGIYVDTNENYPEQLEDLLNSNLKCNNIDKFEVINLGYPGYDIEYSAARFEKRGIKYSPDIVLWFVVNNDFTEVKRFIDELMDSYDAKDRKILSEQYRDNMLEVFNNLGKEKIFSYISDVFDKVYIEYKNPVVVFSNRTILDRPLVRGEEIADFFRDYIKRRPNFSFYNGMVDINSKNMDFPDGHPNAQGYAEIARDLYDYLLDNKFIPCDQ